MFQFRLKKFSLVIEKKFLKRQNVLNGIKTVVFIAIMGDSDDEYDRKGRDKFRGERGGDRRPAGGERERWPERDR